MQPTRAQVVPYDGALDQHGALAGGPGGAVGGQPGGAGTDHGDIGFDTVHVHSRSQKFGGVRVTNPTGGIGHAAARMRAVVFTRPS